MRPNALNSPPLVCPEIREDSKGEHLRLTTFALNAFTALALLPPYMESIAQSQPTPANTIREDAPRTGTSIRRNVVGPSAVPVNLPYERLSEQDKLRFKENYEPMAPEDEPPFPKDGLQALFGPIQKAQQGLLVVGELHLVATVSTTGKVDRVQAFASPGAEMTRFAAQILMLTAFKPAVCAGRACVMDFPLRMQFRVER
jgi:hypothetical protein